MILGTFMPGKGILFNATQLRQGMSLAMDSREPVMDTSVWNGLADIRFEVTDGGFSGFDTVSVKVAPVLVHSHLQSVDKVFTTSGNNTDSSWQAYFVSQLNESLTQDTAQDYPLEQLTERPDIWAQDFFEPGFTSMPGPDGPISLRVMIRSPQTTRIAGRQIFSQLRQSGIGGIQLKGGFGHEEINSGGNIETIPPYTSRSGIHYPVGRTILGKHHSRLPDSTLLLFLESQEIQNPLILETGWLLIGHVDEMVQFLPANSTLGFKIAVADTRAGMALLHTARERGYGSTPALSYNGSTEVLPGEFTFLDFQPDLLNRTVDSLLASERFLYANEYAQRYLDQMLQTLRDEIDLREEDILHVPALFEDLTYTLPATPDGLPPRLSPPLPSERLLKSFFPEALNGLVLNGLYVAPRSFGPMVDGKDILNEAIANVYRSAGLKVEFVDDFMSHHVRGGEVHCATNTLRSTDAVWWN